MYHYRHGQQGQQDQQSTHGYRRNSQPLAHDREGPEKEAKRAYYEELVNELTRKGFTAQQVSEMSTGSVYTTREALEFALRALQLQSRQDAIQALDSALRELDTDYRYHRILHVHGLPAVASKPVTHTRKVLQHAMRLLKFFPFLAEKREQPATAKDVSTWIEKVIQSDNRESILTAMQDSIGAMILLGVKELPRAKRAELLDPPQSMHIDDLIEAKNRIEAEIA